MRCSDSLFQVSTFDIISFKLWECPMEKLSHNTLLFLYLITIFNQETLLFCLFSPILIHLIDSCTIRFPPRQRYKFNRNSKVKSVEPNLFQYWRVCSVPSPTRLTTWKSLLILKIKTEVNTFSLDLYLNQVFLVICGGTYVNYDNQVMKLLYHFVKLQIKGGVILPIEP